MKIEIFIGLLIELIALFLIAYIPDTNMRILILSALTVVAGIVALGPNFKRLSDRLRRWRLLFAIVLVVIIAVVVVIVFVLPNDTPLFYENFEDGKANNFIVQTGNWQVVPDKSGNWVYRVDSRGLTDWPTVYIGDESWGKYMIDFRVRLIYYPLTNSSPLVNVHVKEKYVISINPYYEEIELSLATDTQYSWEQIVQSNDIFEPDVWYRVRIRVTENEISVYLNDTFKFNDFDFVSSSGTPRLQVGPDAIVQFDDILVTRLEE